MLNNLVESFTAVGSRIDSLPMEATYTPNGPTPKVPFIGSGKDASQFSLWLRCLEDTVRVRTLAPKSQQKANFLICYLEGVVREKIEELSEEGRSNIDTVVAHLKQFFKAS